MKVVQINEVYGIGSTGEIVKDIHEFLAGSGIAETYVFCSKIQGKAENVYLIGKWAGKQIHAVGSRLTGCQGHFSYFATLNLLRHLEQIQPDVVHMHNIHGNFIHYPLFLRYLAQKNISTVLTLHDCWFFTGKCVHYHTDNCYRWKEKCGNCPRLKKDNKSYFFDRTQYVLEEKRNLYQDIKKLGVIGVSDWITEQAEASVLGCAKRIIRIYNWLDMDVFTPGVNCSDTEKMIILAVASGWKTEKGLRDIIEVAALLAKDEELIMVGDISEDIELPPQIIHISQIHGSENLVEYYQRATVLLNLSWMESFGKVSAEALACGTPIICYNTTASPELAGDGCGYIVEKGDILGVRAALDKVKGRKAEYTDDCIKFARDNFSKHKNLQKTISLYEELCHCEQR